MAGFANIAEIADAEIAGKVKDVWFRKTPAVVTVTGSWYDYSMAPGTPLPQYYAAAPLESKVMTRTLNGGLHHSGNVSPATKYLRRIMAMCVTAAGVPQRIYLLDYLMFYPFCDMGGTDAQAMNVGVDTPAVLTRYVTGDGVMILPVLVAPHAVAGDSFFVTYTSSTGTNGTAGRVTPLHTMNTVCAVNGTILTTSRAGAGRFGPFMSLQAGDKGVRSIQSVQCTAGTDIGLFTLVLVKPLAEFTIRGIDAPTEKDFLLDAGKMPVIYDDAYLNFISCPTGSLSGAALIGDATFVWN